MNSLRETILAGELIEAHRPWPRAVVSRELWQRAAERLHAGEWALLGLWGEPEFAHLAVIERHTNECAVLSFACEQQRFPSIGRSHAPAIRLERALRDLVGLEPEGLADLRPWLDHGKWGTRHRLEQGAAVSAATHGYPFLPAAGDSLHQVPVGPVHAGIIEPGHFRFTASGETVVRLEERLGYAHRGIETLMAGAPLERAARLAGRLSGDSTVACALAFAQAVEAALAVQVPPRAVWVRALLAELERLANHLGDIGAICNDAAFGLMHAQCGLLREHTLRAAESCFGHRLMMDRVVPGGLGCDLPGDGEQLLVALVALVRSRFPELVELYDNTASLQDRTVGTGYLAPALAQQFACGGYVGRASGRNFDARCTPGYAPYDRLRFEVPVLEEGDVNARVWIRIREIEQSLSLIEEILPQVPPGAICAPVATQAATGIAREGMALTEGFRGDILAWLRIAADGKIERCHLRDPSWFQWPVLEAAIEGNILADFPLCNKSFNCSYAGHDL
ncbi:MAG: hydrogenase expression protein HypE [Betaproteobacteria bacterium RIFCSPLOWO2_12_FULL_67_28]|nr:MAG: hydrogenase expression protein HypE [Betaproteobacteria bacterium RIFCSPLOWO2_02_FULL_68_150]OGA67004.1 MAG: hydrogenase expression protein HypE [Betaproteobacteria bacterium RIFCSPLOWO2_12_FULL_67_28]